MTNIALTEPTRMRLEILFPDEDDQRRATDILVHECGSNLPSCGNATPASLERFRFAALKLSRGDLQRLRDATELAKIDWRDLLMAADFGGDVHAHERWMPQRPD